MLRPGFAIPLVAVLVGCATNAAQRAFDNGDDVGAAKLADEAVEANSRDGVAIALRARARDHTARRELGETAALRAAGHAEAALASLDRLLKQLSDWGGPDILAADLRGSFDAELTAARAFVATIGARDADAGHPLAAEAELAREVPFLAHAELAGAATQAETRIRDAGAAVCARLQTTVAPTTPHWTYAVSRYCDHFGVGFAVPVQETPPFALDGVVVGLAPEQGASLAAHVRGWLEASFWAQAGGVAAPQGKLQGKIESSFQHGSVTLHATYRDTITSHAVRGDKSIEEIREERPLGDLFVKQNTASSQFDRSFAYDAEEARGHYVLTIDVSLDLGDEKPVTLSLRHTENLKAYDHDVTFEPAGIFPRHDRVPTTASWVEAQLDRMSGRVVAALNRRFVATHCARSTYTPDEAARCLAAGQKPRVALAVVGDVLGENAERVAPLLKPAPPPAKPAAAKSTRKPADDDNLVID